MRLFTILFLISVPTMAWSAEFSGRAVDLEGNNIRNVRVEVISSFGVIIGSAFSADGNYGITVPDSLLQQQGPAVRVRFRATGRETVTLSRIFGEDNQQLAVVMPEVAKRAMPTKPPCPRRWRLFRWFRC